MKNTGIILLIVCSAIIFLSGCKKEKGSDAVDSEFCAFISKKNYTGTKSLINNFLKGQKGDMSDRQKLDQLADWLKSKSCVADANVLCTSCIYTLPAQSELKVIFIIDGKLAENVLGIIMDQPLRFGAFHIQ